MPACSGRKCPSSFREGGRFLSSPHRRHRRCDPLSVHCLTDSGLAYPRRAYSCRTSPAAAAFGYRSAARTAPLPLGLKCRTIRAPSPILPKAPPRPASLLQFCPKRRHGPRPFSCSTGRRTADPRPFCPGHKKGGRNRTEVRPPPKSNQSVAAASPRQVFNPSGQCTRLKQTRSV